MAITDLPYIAAQAERNQQENDRFRGFLQAQDPLAIDALVFELNDLVSAEVDCTACGNCCRSLMINLETGDSQRLADRLEMKLEAFQLLYVERSNGGMEIMNTIPCHFLQNNKCNVYESRPSECREFPGLHRENFTGRSFASFMHYGRCPIIYNVIELLKQRTRFSEA